ncbi:MAG: hypothetical protein NZ853_06595 [Leptospiraceae bacterium]|nr:hypothetical protein [Leptospiraceae bacterium]MDW7975898.1 hypothetical protein [Leptospiraceae bacterium]
MAINRNQVLSFFQWVRENLSLLIVSALVLGAVKGYFYPMEFSRVICGAAMFFMVYPIMINLKIEDSFKEFKNFSKVLWVSFLVNFLISPIIAIGIILLFLQQNVYLAIGLLLIGSIPTSGLTLNWIHQFKGNMKMGILLVSFNIITAFLLVPIFVPILSNFILKSDFTINSWVIIEKIFFIIVVPMILAYLTRLYFRKTNNTEFLQNNKEIFSGISNLGLMLVMFLLMSLENSQYVFQNVLNTLIVIPAIFLYYIAMFFVFVFGIKRFLKDDEVIPLFLSTFLRYHIISLGIAISAFGETQEGILVMVPIILGILIQPTVVSLLGKKYVLVPKTQSLFPSKV